MNNSNNIQYVIKKKEKCLSLVKELEKISNFTNLNVNKTQQETINEAKDNLNEKILNCKRTYQEKNEKLKQLTMQCSKHILNANALKEEINRLTTTIESKESQLKKISEEQRRLAKHKLTVIEPKAKYQYQLMTDLFPIKWEHEMPDRVSGYILEPKSRKIVHPFEFEPEKNSQFFICDFLWHKLRSTSSSDQLG